jgi:D-3-phosphoglycerate dehydrogenase
MCSAARDTESKCIVAVEGNLRDDKGEIPGARVLEQEPSIEVRYPRSGYMTEIEPDDIKGCDAIVISSAYFTRASLAGSDGRLKLIVRFGAGFERVDLDACTEHGIMVCHAPLGPTEPMAQGTLGLMIACATRMFQKDDVIRRGKWGERVHHMGTDLTGKTLGLIGLGNIGTRVVDKVAPFDMKVIAYDPYAPDQRFKNYGVQPVSLETVLKEADFISVHCPLTEESRSMLKEEHFKMMKPTALFFNTSRGGFYEDRLLARALTEGWINGAGIDVFEDEPNIENNPLVEIGNCIVTPHAIGFTQGLFETIFHWVSRSIMQFANNELPDNIVNIEVLPPDQRVHAVPTSSYIHGRVDRKRF